MLSFVLSCLRRVLAGGALPLLALLVHAGAAACEVRINEFLPAPGRDWDGSGVYSARDDEWVELVNDGDVMFDLSTIVISDADSTWRWRGSGLMGPHERLAIYGSQAVNWQRDTGATIAGFSFANAGDTVRLWRIAGAETLLVESYTFRAHEAGTDRSVGRHPDVLGAWALFDGLNPYTGGLDPQGNACVPTPGQPNSCGITPAEPSTWGRIKGVYR